MFEVVEKIRIENDAVLDDLGQSAAELAVGQRAQRRAVDAHADGLMKRADQVLARG